MAETSRTRRNTGSRADSPGTGVTGWAGWVVFAGIMLIMLGFFQAIEGLVALFNDGFYLVRAEGLVVNVDYNAWGWTHLVLGVIIIYAIVVHGRALQSMHV